MLRAHAATELAAGKLFPVSGSKSIAPGSSFINSANQLPPKPKFPVPRRQSSKFCAQSLFNLVIVGVGIIVGSYIATGVAGIATGEDGTMNYTMLFSVPMWASIACLVVLLIAYLLNCSATSASVSVGSASRMRSARRRAFCTQTGTRTVRDEL